MKGRRLEFSKLLAIIVTLTFIGTWAVAWVVWIKTQTLPTDLLSFISTPFSVVITGYFAKAGVENYTKIRNNGENM